MRARRRWVRCAAVVLTTTAVVGCGSDEPGTFDARVAEVRAAVESGDHQAAQEALDALAMHALAAHDEGTVSDAELGELSELIESSRVLLGQVVPPPTTTTTSTTTTTTTTEPPPPVEHDDDEDEKDDKDEDKDDEKGEGRGRGNGPGRSDD